MTDTPVFIISPSSLDDVMTCPRRYYYSHIRQIVPQGHNEKIELGIAVHKLLERYYGLVMDAPAHAKIGQVVEVIDAIIESVTKELVVDLQYPPDTIEKAFKLFKEYIAHYAGDKWVPLAVEAPFTKVAYESPELIIVVEGKTDLIVKDPQIPKLVVDHKVSGRRQDPTILDHQAHAYCWMSDTFMFIRNQIGTQKTLSVSDRMQRYPLSIDKERIDAWLQDVIYYCKETHKFVQEGNFPRNFGGCSKFGGCQYRFICEAHPRAAEARIKMFYKDKPPHDLYSNEEV